MKNLQNNTNKTPSIFKTALKATLLLTLISLVSLIPDPTFAQAGSSPFDSIDKVGTEVNNWLSGTFLAWMGTISLIIFGIALKFGKADWTKGIHVVGSILFIANAAVIVTWIISFAK